MLYFYLTISFSVFPILRLIWFYVTFSVIPILRLVWFYASFSVFPIMCIVWFYVSFSVFPIMCLVWFYISFSEISLRYFSLLIKFTSFYFLHLDFQNFENKFLIKIQFLDLYFPLLKAILIIFLTNYPLLSFLAG